MPTQPSTRRLVTEAAAAIGSAYDRDRSHHTGTQVAATISDFTEAAQDAIAALLAGASGVTLAYNDAANTLTITGGGSGGTLDAEAVRDAIGVAMVGVGNITVTVNDAADTITISTTATANSTDSQLRDRSTHTGTQAQSTITGLITTLAASAVKAETVGYRIRINSTTWETRPTGYKFVVSVGADPSPTDQQPGDQRQIPAP